MRKESYQQEFPVLNPEVELPDLPVYRRHRPLIFLPLSLTLISVTALLSVPDSAPLFRGLSLIVLVLSLIVVVMMTKKSLEERRETTHFLNTSLLRFAAAAQERYGVALTETIIYSLAQGGSNHLTDKDRELRLVKIGTLPGESRTKLLTT